jgi:type VI secretion system secreted protein Hcp
MASYFLKIDGVEGESQQDGHVGEIEIEAYTWGEANAGSAAHGGGGGAGKVTMQDFHFTMRSSKASPKLMLACATGQHFKEATLTGLRSGDRPQQFLKYRLTDVLVSSYAIDGDPPHESRPADQVSLDFARIELDYTPQQPDGSAGTPVHFGFDLRSNRTV